MPDRDVRRKQINWSKADFRRSNFLRCRRRLLGMPLRDMDNGVMFIGSLIMFGALPWLGGMDGVGFVMERDTGP
jgi:hypothetical protein